MLEILSLLDSKLGRFVGSLGAGAIALAVAFATGFVKGDEYRAGVDDARGARAKIEFLQKQLEAHEAAAKWQAEQAQADNAALTAQLEEAKNAQAQVSVGPCLDSGDVERLRKLWPVRAPKHKR